MKKLLSLLSLAAVAAVACATGTSTTDVANDVSLTEADGGGGARLPPPAQSGDASDAGEPSLDAAGSKDADAASTLDAGIDSSSTSAACGPGSTQLGEYATWSGKVNVHHASGGAWAVDSDCTSGANVNTVAYCQKFWPTATKQVQLAAPSADAKPFTSGGGSGPTCGGVALAAGQQQYACCNF